MPESRESSLMLKHFLPYRLVNLAQNVSEKFAEVYQSEFNLTTPEWRILVHLAEHDDRNNGNGKSDPSDDRDEKEERNTSTDSAGISAKDLTVLASMDKSTVSRAVKVMLDKGYLIKRLDENDKRASVLALTQQGKHLYQTIVPKALAWEADLLDVLSASEYRDLMRIIDKLDNRLV
ncbi:MarR family winged helix-turn-helix transcriptional regulator [Shewanella benthica]|uniref:Putative bacterial regulatory protein, MarR family n=1 Tax=Shewanella benthica KT99 TaxID=314608 RepID=A9CZ19_9GAMM|nr:MarR family transcriptional regulator [Shewanella benthica]EDQ02231.1 putative bacterial regulatory protein, MarR family [Shewanella benthica KT99]